MNVKNFYFALIALVFCAFSSKAQEDLPGFDHYTVKDGLPTQTIYNVLQDKKGFLWITTDAGVSRFDGTNFVNYTTENGLGDNEVLSLYEDKKGRIWFVPFSARQSYYLDGKLYNNTNDSLLKKLAQHGVISEFTETVTHDIYAQIRGKQHSILRIDRHNKVTLISLGHLLDVTDYITAFYLSADNSAVYCITHNDKMILVSAPEPKEVKVPYKDFADGGTKAWGTNSAAPSRILYINDNGLYTINDTTNTLLLPAQEIPLGKKDDVIMLMDKHSNIWICNRRHNTFFYRYTGNGYAPAVQVLKDMYAIVAIDNEDNLWFCTGNKGLFKIPYKKLIEDVLPGIKERLLQKSILCIHTDSEGSLWTGYSNGFITRIYGNEIKHYDLNFGNRNYNRVLQIHSDYEGNVWCATDETCVLLQKKAKGVYKRVLLKNTDGEGYYAPIKGIASDNKGTTYITIPKYIFAVQKLTLQTNIVHSVELNSRIYSCFFDTQNTCYVSCLDGLHKIKGTVTKNLSITEPRLNVRIQHYAQSADGTIFLATYSDGVLALKNDKVVANLGRTEGLAGMICRRVYLRNDTLYIVTNGGITVAKYKNGRLGIIQTIGLDDGLHSIDVYDIAFLKNTLYAATAEGLSTFTLPLQKQYKVLPPVLTILSFTVNETLYSTHSAIAFPYQQQRVRIEYIAPVMVNPGMVTYRYRFEGSSEWHTTSATQLEFSDLHHGDFKLEIQAKKSNSDWSASKEIAFTILPPFYSTLTFKGLVLLCAIAGLYMIIRNRFTKRFREQLAQLQQNEAIEKERNRIAADIHDDIGAELTHIVLLSRILKENSPHTVPFTDMVDKLEKSSNEVINKMNEVIWTLNAANHTLHNLAAYLHNYCARLLEEHGLKSVISIDENVFTDHLVKADVSRNIFLIIKESLHNIIKHSEASEVKIYFMLQQGHILYFEIKDNGKGFNSQYLTGGNGLGNIHKRADVLQGTVNINSQPGTGCIIKAKIPL
jgi:signal transduction histidine kinase/ligand-binding sensor domain-containing protein